MLKLLKDMLKSIQKGARSIQDFIMRYPALGLLLLLIIAFIIFMRRREDFRFIMPDLKKETSCKDFGYVCCADSYAKGPILIQQCEGGSDGRTMFYKYRVKGSEAYITSGLFNDYIVHAPGAYIRFSDNKLYKLITQDPSSEPADCRIVKINDKYEDAQSYIPVSY